MTSIETIKIKVRYGVDPDGKNESFYWPGSPSKRKEAQSVRRGSPADFESTYQQNPGNREGVIFTEADFAYYDAPLGLSIGISSPDVKALCLRGHGVFTAWDTAFSATSQAAYTVGITGLFMPCTQYHCGEDPAQMGECEPHFDVALLDVYRKKLDAGDLGGRGLTDAVKEQYYKWLPETLVVEKKASGITLIQALPSLNIPVIGVNPGESKRARAVNTVNGAGSAQGWFRLHRVLFPREAAWLDALKTELKDFTGDESAVTDQVDAIVHLVCHAISIGARTTLLPTGWTPDRVEPTAVYDAVRDSVSEMDMRAAFVSMLGELPAMSEDPYEASCARCEKFDKGRCKQHDRAVTPFDLCEFFSVPGQQNAQDMGQT